MATTQIYDRRRTRPEDSPTLKVTDGRFHVQLDDDYRIVLEEVGSVQAGNIGYRDAGRLEVRTMFRSRPASQARGPGADPVVDCPKEVIVG